MNSNFLKEGLMAYDPKTGKTSEEKVIPKWNTSKRKWESLGDMPKMAGKAGKAPIYMPWNACFKDETQSKTNRCQIRVEDDGTPIGKPNQFWQYSNYNESKSLRQKIVQEIKKILKEAPLGAVDPTGYASGDMTSKVPSQHRMYLQKFATWVNARGGSEDPKDLIAQMDTQLRKGSSTDQVYDLIRKAGGLYAGFLIESPPPPNYKLGGGAGTTGGTSGGDTSPTPGPRTPRRARLSGGSGSGQYFRCKKSFAFQKTKEYQKENGLKDDGLIGADTYAQIVLDPKFKTPNFDLSGAQRIKFPEAMRDPGSQQIICSLLSGMSGEQALSITGGMKGPKGGILDKQLDAMAGKESGADLEARGGDISTKYKCPSWMPQTGPFDTDIIDKYLRQQGVKERDVIEYSSLVTRGLDKTEQSGGTPNCANLIDFAQAAIKTKGKSLIHTSAEYNNPLASETEAGYLRLARVLAFNGATRETLQAKGAVPEVIAAADKMQIYNPKSRYYAYRPNSQTKEEWVATYKNAEPVVDIKTNVQGLGESKNWLDRTREKVTSNLFERLVKNMSKKKVI